MQAVAWIAFLQLNLRVYKILNELDTSNFKTKFDVEYLKRNIWNVEKYLLCINALTYLVFVVLHIQFSLVLAGNDLWPMDRPEGMPNIVSLEVMCGKDHMDVHLTFSHPFEGIVSSKGN